MAKLLYFLLKCLCTFSLKLYFRKWETHGEEFIPEGPVIFVPNHHNAFLDAILVTCSCKKNPWYLTRAKVFAKPRVASFLNKLQMLPIYRFRDGFDAMKKNNLVMEDVIHKLNRRESILIFAEGSHSERDVLAPLQKGVTKIALAVKPDSNVAIIPVGLRYESPNSFKSDVFVNFGKPLYVNTFTSGNESENTEQLLATLRSKLEPLMLHIGDENYEEKLHYLQTHRQIKATLKEQLESDQHLIKSYPAPLNVVTTKKENSLIQKLFRSYVNINSILPTLLIKNFILNKIKDPQFIGSVKFASGMFITPVFWLLQAVLIGILLQSVFVGVIYFCSIVVAVKLS